MDRKIKLYVDIINAINYIEEFLGPINLFQQYSVDIKTKSVIERQLGIIGEAVKKIRDIESKHSKNDISTGNSELEEPMPYQHEIIGLRNRLIHGYDNINDYVIWSVLKDYLIPLREYVANKLLIE